MELSCLLITSRSAVLKLFDGGKYHTLQSYRVVVNGETVLETNHTITSL